MQRYEGIKILKNSDGVRYYKNVIYPDIPVSINDIYIESIRGDRVDNLSYQYYKNTEDYWIISVANKLPKDSLYVPAGIQLRIPIDTVQIKQDYLSLNKV